MQSQHSGRASQSQAQSNGHPAPRSDINFDGYDTDGFYDELIDEHGQPRPGCDVLVKMLEELNPGELLRRQATAERLLFRMGITFNVYGADEGTEKIFPFDLVPRIMAAEEWRRISEGLKQRIRALNLFIDDIYHDQQIIKDGILPGLLLDDAKSFREACRGLNPPHGIWCHITGTDLVRGGDGQIYVLEDNLRCPSGVS